jgi:hypothetical protein
VDALLFSRRTRGPQVSRGATRLEVEQMKRLAALWGTKISRSRCAFAPGFSLALALAFGVGRVNEVAGLGSIACDSIGDECVGGWIDPAKLIERDAVSDERSVFLLHDDADVASGRSTSEDRDALIVRDDRSDQDALRARFGDGRVGCGRSLCVLGCGRACSCSRLIGRCMRTARIETDSKREERGGRNEKKSGPHGG